MLYRDTKNCNKKQIKKGHNNSNSKITVMSLVLQYLKIENACLTLIHAWY